jgi:hypothetical protein
VLDTIPSPIPAPRTDDGPARRPRRTNLAPQVVVAGCGYWGRNLVRVFKELGVLRAVCEPGGPAAEQSRHIAPTVPVVAAGVRS